MNRSLRNDFLQESCGMMHGKKKKKEKKKTDEAYSYSVDDAIEHTDKLFDTFGMLKKMVKSSKMEAAWKKFIAVVNTEVSKMPKDE